MSSVHQLVDKAITCHCLSPDGSKVAVSTNDEVLRIFRRVKSAGAGWEEEAVLKAHEQVITAMDWSIDGKLLTVSADRNGYVWDHQLTASNSTKEWIPKLVLLRFKRGAMCCQWSGDGKYFAVGGAEGVLAIGHYESDNDWWVTKHVKLDTSVILSLTWHPSDQSIAVSTALGNIHIIDNTLESDIRPTLLKIGSWICGMNYSPNGSILAAAAHNGKLYIIKDGSVTSALECSEPLRRVLAFSETCLIVSGYTKDSLFIFHKSGSDSWELKGNVNKLCTRNNQSQDVSSSSSSSAAMAFAKFKALDIQGINNTSGGSVSGSIKKNNISHIGRISDLRIHNKTNLFTSGHDGRLVEWDLRSII